MYLKTILATALSATAIFACSVRPDIIKDNIANAEIQTGLLMEASEEGDTVRMYGLSFEYFR